MIFPKVVNKIYLDSLSNNEILQIKKYINKTKSRKKWAKKYNYTIAHEMEYLSKDGAWLKINSNSGNVSIHGYGNDKFNYYSGKDVICFYAYFAESIRKEG